VRSPAAIAKLYTDRALQLIRLGNGQSLSVRTELRKLASGLRVLLDGQALPAMRKRELTALLKKIEALIAERFDVVSEQQSAAAEELASIEAAWASEASGFDVDIDEGTLNGIASGLLIFGVPLAVMWSRQRDDLVTRVAGAVREVAAGAAAPETLLPRIMGSSPSREVGGLLQAALRNADALAHTTVAQVATDARIPVWKANGVNAFRWHAVLDEKTTAGCAIRHGLIYTIDGLEPINHKVPIERTPPRHYRCRSILLPMAYTSKLPAPKDGGQQTFRDYFDSLSEAEQDRLFGQGRAILFRRGVITQTDLVGQYGQVLSLDELRLATTPETQIALWWRKPRGDLVVGSLPKRISDALGASDSSVLLSSYTRKKQLSHHPEISAEDYARLPQMLSNPVDHFSAGKDRHVAIIGDSGRLWVVIVKADLRGKLFLQSFRMTSPDDINRLRQGPRKKKGSH